MPVQLDGSTDEVRRCGEMLLSERMREYDHRIGIGRGILSRAKEASDDGLNPQYVEIVPRNEFYTNPGGAAAFVKVHARCNRDAAPHQAREVGAGLLEV